MEKLYTYNNKDITKELYAAAEAIKEIERKITINPKIKNRDISAYLIGTVLQIYSNLID